MRVIHLKMVPGTNLKKVRIHWFIRDDTKGPVATPSKEIGCNKGSIIFGGVRGYLACQPRQEGVLPVVRPDGIYMTMRTDDIRAATCPECLASDEADAYRKKMEDTAEVAV